MKKIFTFSICFLGLIISSFAQPIINYSSTHSIGTEANLYFIDGETTNLSLTGANVTWDLSTNYCMQLGTFNAVDPSTTPYASDYLAADYAFRVDGSSVGQGVSYIYFIDSPTGEAKMAESVGSASQVIFVDYQETMKYPLNYSDSFEGTSQVTDGSPIDYTSTYDAYGTLIINEHTYNNVVRVSSTTGEILWIMTSPVIYPLIFMSNGNYGYNEPTVYTGIENLKNKAQITAYPNPASDIVILNINNTNHGALTLNVYNVFGALVKTESITQNQQQINVSGLNDGVYMLEIKSNSFTEKQKLIIQR